MKDHAPQSMDPSEHIPLPPISELIERDMLNKAIEVVSRTSYDSHTPTEQVYDLKLVLHTLHRTENGAKIALSLIDALVPRPETSSSRSRWQEQNKYDASFYDYVIQDTAIAALQQKDFATAQEVVERMDEWYIGPAMGGGDLIDLAYHTEDPGTIAATWTLIRKHWGTGIAADKVPELATTIMDQVMINAINNWLDDTDIDYRIPDL